MQHEIYLDANATTPALPAAAASAQHAMRILFGNPSSTHCAGLRARDIMDTVRARAARVLGSGDGRILFVSGATEAIQTAVLSALCAIRKRQQQGRRVGRVLLYGAVARLPPACAALATHKPGRWRGDWRWRVTRKPKANSRLAGCRPGPHARPNMSRPADR